MTKPLAQTERDRFQRWVDIELPSLMKGAVIADPYHAEVHVLDAAWEAWQAAIASMAAPDTPPMPETWHVVAHVHGEPILSIGYDWLSGKELDEAEEQAVIGMAKHLLAFVGYGLPPSHFALDDDAPQDPPIAALAAKETT